MDSLEFGKSFDLTCNLEFPYKYYALMGWICHLLGTVSSEKNNTKHKIIQHDEGTTKLMSCESSFKSSVLQ